MLPFLGYTFFSAKMPFGTFIFNKLFQGYKKGYLDCKRKTSATSRPLSRSSPDAQTGKNSLLHTVMTISIDGWNEMPTLTCLALHGYDSMQRNTVCCLQDSDSNLSIKPCGQNTPEPAKAAHQS